MERMQEFEAQKDHTGGRGIGGEWKFRDWEDFYLGSTQSDVSLGWSKIQCIQAVDAEIGLF